MGEIDLATAGQVQSALNEALGAGTVVELDLSEVTFIDSTGLRAILLTHNSAQEQGREFTVTGANAAARRLLELTGVAEVVRAPPDGE